MEKGDYVKFLEELDANGFARRQDYEGNLYEFRRTPDGKLKYGEVHGPGKWQDGGSVTTWSKANTTTLKIQFGIGDRLAGPKRVG